LDTTYDEARRCPKCNELGEITSKQPVRITFGDRRAVTAGAQLHTATCMNERCKWFGQTCRLIQVNPDGTVPPPVTKRAKHFPAIPDLTDQVNASLAAQLEAERKGNSEVRN